MIDKTREKGAGLSSGGMQKCVPDTEALVRQLSRIAFSTPNDAIALACGCCAERISNLDLSAVAEFKQKEEQTEIKFLDRVRAIQVLWEILSAQNSAAEDETALSFLQALKENHGEGEAVD